MDDNGTMGTDRTTKLFDMHCHLGFVAEVDAVRLCLAADGPAALSCTVSPTEFERDVTRFAGLPRCRIALGLHPWHLADGSLGEEELRRFEELVPATAFIGEVGLDFGGARDDDESRRTQLAAFERVLAACDGSSQRGADRKLLSIHAVRAASAVLDALEAHGTLQRHDCIFHWFSGSSDELQRAVELGCAFSVGPRMLATKRGRAYAQAIPETRLLLETDSPAHLGDAWDGASWVARLEETLDALAALRRVTPEWLAGVIAATSERLLTRG